jgi:hypothetical protein
LSDPSATTYDETIDQIKAIVTIDLALYKALGTKKSGVTKKRLWAYIEVLKDLERRQKEEQEYLAEEEE